MEQNQKPCFKKCQSRNNKRTHSRLRMSSITLKREKYINKYLTLTENIISKNESNRFLKTVQNLRKLKSGQLNKLNIEIKKSILKRNFKRAIF